VHADQGFAILHDFVLDRETTGGGVVRKTSAAQLRQLHLRGNDGTPTADKVMLLDDVCTLLAEETPHPEALLQLDCKEKAGAITPKVIEKFAKVLAPIAGSIILSGGDFDAIASLAHALPQLRTGYDPCDGPALDRLRQDGDYEGFIADALKIAPDAAFIYLSHELVLSAEDAGFDMVAPVHAAGRKVDAWTIRAVDETSLGQVRRLLALKVDQITTDDPEGLSAALSN
jgi:glycerophosphoryl diester phosphodiesterase